MKKINKLILALLVGIFFAGNALAAYIPANPIIKRTKCLNPWCGAIFTCPNSIVSPSGSILCIQKIYGTSWMMFKNNIAPLDGVIYDNHVMSTISFSMNSIFMPLDVVYLNSNLFVEDIAHLRGSFPGEYYKTIPYAEGEGRYLLLLPGGMAHMYGIFPGRLLLVEQ